MSQFSSRTNVERVNPNRRSSRRVTEIGKRIPLARFVIDNAIRTGNFLADQLHQLFPSFGRCKPVPTRIVMFTCDALLFQNTQYGGQDFHIRNGTRDIGNDYAGIRAVSGELTQRERADGMGKCLLNFWSKSDRAGASLICNT